MYNPVKLQFGKGVVDELGEAASKIGKKAMIVYGSGSVKNNGSYDDVVQQLRKYNIDFIHLTTFLLFILISVVLLYQSTRKITKAVACCFYFAAFILVFLLPNL